MNALEKQVDADFGHSTPELLNIRDQELRSIHSRLARRKFALHRLFGSISVSVETEQKNLEADEVWYRSIQFTGVTESQIETIESFIETHEYNLAVEIGKTKTGEWAVEII